MVPRLPRMGLTHLAGLLATAALLAAGCGGGGHASPPPPVKPSPAQAAHRPPLLSMFEAGGLSGDPTAVLTQLRRLGVDVVRVFVPWGALAPNAAARHLPAGENPASPGIYQGSAWASYDGIVRAAAAEGIAIDLTLEAPAPLWAVGPGVPRGGLTGPWRPNAADYGAFVRAVAGRYTGSYAPPGATRLPRVHMWSIWNEPNYGVQLAPQATDHSQVEVAPAIYRGLVDAAWSALAATGHGHDTILLGELAPRGQTFQGHPGNYDGMVPLRFLRALYCVDGSLKPLQGAAASQRGCPRGGGSAAFSAQHPALFQASGYALHLYPQGALAPNVVTPGEPDYADLATLPRFERTLDTIMSAYGSHKRFPIYDTEFGYKTNPPYAYGVPAATAATYLSWSEYMHWRDPRVASYDQYLLMDPGPPSRFDSGIETSAGTPKPSFFAYRMPLYMPVTRAGSAARLEVWGCARPSGVVRARTGRPQVATLQFAPSGSTRFAKLRSVTLTDPSCYFDLRVPFTRSGQLRLAWSPVHGPAIYSLPIRVTIG